MIKGYLSGKIRDWATAQGVSLTEVIIEEPRQAGFGDYAANFALMIAKQLGKSPREIADAFVQAWEPEEFIEKVTVAGPGFINFTLSHRYLEQTIRDIDEQYGRLTIGQGKRYVIEYSCPNTNKPLHIGHTRNNCLGQALINIMRQGGYEVVSTSVMNDRGIHIMKSLLMYYKFGQGETPAQTGEKPDHFVGRYYVMFEQQKTPELEAENLVWLERWEAGDPEVRALWQQFNDWFYTGVNQTYAAQGVTFDKIYYESDLYDQGRAVVEDGVARGVFHKETAGELAGTVVADLTADGLDKKVLLRSNGTTVYITQDIYLASLRNQEYHPEGMFYVVANEQRYHFQVLFLIFKKLGYPFAEKCVHVGYGMVVLPQGKMSSREGTAISADDFLAEIEKKVQETMEASPTSTVPREDIPLVSHQVADGAIKYGILRYAANSDIVFEMDKTIAITGNTGPYIQYTHARIKEILRKVGTVDPDADLAMLTHGKELALMRRLVKYPEAVEKAVMDVTTTAICNYLFDLCADFNSFYNECSVLQAESPALRLARALLIDRVAQVIRSGLALLSIAAPERM